MGEIRFNVNITKVVMIFQHQYFTVDYQVNSGFYSSVGQLFWRLESFVKQGSLASVREGKKKAWMKDECFLFQRKWSKLEQQPSVHERIEIDLCRYLLLQTNEGLN